MSYLRRYSYTVRRTIYIVKSTFAVKNYYLLVTALIRTYVAKFRTCGTFTRRATFSAGRWSAFGWICSNCVRPIRFAYGRSSKAPIDSVCKLSAVENFRQNSTPRNLEIFLKFWWTVKRYSMIIANLTLSKAIIAADPSTSISQEPAPDIEVTTRIRRSICSRLFFHF